MTDKIKAVWAFLRDEAGASYVEYSVLIGVTLAISLAVVAAVAQWANGQWVSLNTAVNP